MSQEGALTLRRTAVAVAAVAGLEFAWLYTLLYVTSRGLHLTFSVPPLLLAYAAAFALALGLRARRRSLRVTKFLSWLAWPVVTLLLLMFLLYTDTGVTTGTWTGVLLRALKGIPRDPGSALFIVPATAVPWWLGTRLATSRVTYETVLVEFQCGLMALAGALFVGYTIGVHQSVGVPTAVVFVGLGLVGAAATRADQEHTPLFFRRGRTWWGMLLISVAVVLVLGLVAGILFTPELMRLVAHGLRALWGLVDRLLGAIAGLFSSADSGTMPPSPATDAPTIPDGGQGFSLTLPDWLLRPSRIIYGLLLGGLALVAAWRIASQLFDWMRRKAGAGRVEIESLPGAFRLDLARLFRRLLAWMSKVLAVRALRRKPHKESVQTASVRRLYGDMLRWGAKSGFPRGSSQTPFEYQQTLCVALPFYRAEVTSITESYVRARYGAQPPTDAELHQLRESGRKLKQRVGLPPAGC